MKTQFIAALLCLSTIVAMADNPASELKEARVSLFNGKDLSGWKQLGGNAKYEVINGEIIGTSAPNTPNAFLATTERYGDFILELEVKVDPLLNSGIQFRSNAVSTYREGRVHGYQMEVDPSERAWSGGIYDESRRGWLYPGDLNPQAGNAFKSGEWNTYRIECIGNSLRTWVNGVPAAHLVDAESKDGFIALQVHAIDDAALTGKQVRWRKVFIQTKNLKPSPPDETYVVNMIPNDVSSAEKAKGYRLLWDGKTTKGWRGVNKDKFPESGWAIKDGELQVMSSGGWESRNGGDIVTDEMFAAFELAFDFKLTEGANSGVKYFVTEKENNEGSAIGMEYQILDDARHPDAKLGREGNRTLASLYDMIKANKTPQSLRAIGEWNKGLIKVFPNNKIEYYLNGVKVLEFVRGSPEFLALVEQSKYKVWPDFGMAPKGRILLQDHGDQVMFRSIKIKEL